ncbi:MAG: PQQ-binding-like beta-propeller repeat protein, partial [Chloroflexi bacterium]|nr:PQQ-binding-like beta-propeller repeat protein [Chloroflexota bacterium]
FLNPGFFAVPTAQWGFASSPVIHKGRIITQCDVNDQSFIAAFNAKTGKEIWRTNREEEAGFSTPTIVSVNGKDQIVVNGWHRRGGYDFETGEEIWFMDGGGDIPVPTPIIAHGMSFYSSSHGPVRPLYAIKLEAKGDISLKNGEVTNDYIAWSKPRRGAYLPTPIIVGDYLYVGTNAGIV